MVLLKILTKQPVLLMIKNIFYITLLTLISFPSFAKTKEVAFSDWLVSCKKNSYNNKNDCFIGTAFQDEKGNGAIIFTKHYLAVSHDEINLSYGVEFEVDKEGKVPSYMNTGLNSFFKNDDRKTLLSQMEKGNFLEINIRNNTIITKSLLGFNKAYNFYIKQLEGNI